MPAITRTSDFALRDVEGSLAERIFVKYVRVPLGYAGRVFIELQTGFTNNAFSVKDCFLTAILETQSFANVSAKATAFNIAFDLFTVS